MCHRPPDPPGRACPSPRSTGSRRRCAGMASTCGGRRRAEPHRHNRGMVRVLAVADEVDEGLCADLGRARGAELILACGDLPFDYLAYLMNGLDVPLVFVPGNHDP